jgi:hypothetical protein
MTTQAPARSGRKLRQLRGWRKRSYAVESSSIRESTIVPPIVTDRPAQSEAKDEAVKLRGQWRSFHAKVERKASIDLSRLEATVLTSSNETPTRSRQRMPREIAREILTGRVDNVRDGIALVTLFPKNELPFTAQWAAKELARRSISKSDLFELTMIDTGFAVIQSFRRLKRKPIPTELLAEIESMKEAYAGLLTGESDGDRE